MVCKLLGLLFFFSSSVALADVSWDVSVDPVKAVTLTGNAKLLNASNQSSGATYKLVVTEDSSGGWVLSHDTGYEFPVVTYQGHPTVLPPTVAPGIGAVTVYTYHSDGTHMLLTGAAYDLEMQVAPATGLAASTNQTGNVHLSWTAGGGDHALVQMADGLGGWNDVVTVTAATTSYDDAEAAGSYTYRVLMKRDAAYGLASGSAVGTAL